MSSNSSYRRINYKLRPAKTVERKMIVDIVRRASSFFKIESYQYIGFGSIYFADFVYFHRALGIDKMISIEKSTSDKERFNFNKPYSCIDIHFKKSTEVLAQLKLDQPSILWLDYDGKIESDTLHDIQTFCSKATPGSFLIMTLNVKSEDFKDEEERTVAKNNIEEFRYGKLVDAIGKGKIPVGITGSHLNKKKLPGVIRSILLNEIEEALSIRNGVVSDQNKIIEFKQVMNFTYEDGVKMLTIGGVLVAKSQEQLFNSASFGDLPFTSESDKSYDIDVPNLTIKEISYLDSILHSITNFSTGDVAYDSKRSNSIPEADVNKYIKLYRYYPTFLEAFL